VACSACLTRSSQANDHRLLTDEIVAHTHYPARLAAERRFPRRVDVSVPPCGRGRRLRINVTSAPIGDQACRSVGSSANNPSALLNESVAASKPQGKSPGINYSPLR